MPDDYGIFACDVQYLSMIKFSRFILAITRWGDRTLSLLNTAPSRHTKIYRDMSLLNTEPCRQSFRVRQVRRHLKVFLLVVCYRILYHSTEWCLRLVSLLKYKRQMTGNKLCKPSHCSGIDLHIICYQSHDLYTSITDQIKHLILIIIEV